MAVMDDSRAILTQLAAVIDDRKRRRPSGSYTTQLFDSGVEAIGAKIREEAAELVEAAAAHEACRDDSTQHQVVHEAADLLYHLLVLLADRGLSLTDVEAELARRFGTSGLDEKASRAGR